MRSIVENLHINLNGVFRGLDPKLQQVIIGALFLFAAWGLPKIFEGINGVSSVFAIIGVVLVAQIIVIILGLDK